MSGGLSEVAVLLAQKAHDIETARDIFKDEIGVLVSGLVSALRRSRSDPWSSSRIRLELPREIETETKAVSRVTDHYAIARIGVRFKRGTNFVQVAEIRFGVELEDPSPQYNWAISFNVMSRYLRIDDLLWSALKTTKALELPGQSHKDKTNTVVFVSRGLNADLTAETAFSDLKSVMEFILNSDSAFAEAVGLDPNPVEGSG
jgi:hypothetical protein